MPCLEAPLGSREHGHRPAPGTHREEGAMSFDETSESLYWQAASMPAELAQVPGLDGASSRQRGRSAMPKGLVS